MIALFLVLSVADAGTPPGEFKNPVDIQCDHGRMEGPKQQLFCVGHVRVKRNTTDITCDRLIAYYANRNVNEVKRFECLGNVEAVDGDRWAKGDYADFNNEKEILVLTGSPQARQGNNVMHGTRVIFYVTTDLIEVDNVTGTLESKGQEEKRKEKKRKAPPP
ncbi:MAG TPA: LptA/OstA family protein [Myxococcaceae bacterium]|nr:LptA/OstA family protein [Myxococcaceae bacterium]